MVSNRDRLGRIRRYRLMAVIAIAVGLNWVQAGHADDATADTTTRKVVQPVAAVSADVNRCETLNVDPTGSISIPVEIFGIKTEFFVCTGIRYGFCLDRFRDELAALPKPEHQRLPVSAAGLEFFSAPDMKIGKTHQEVFRSKYGIALSSTGSSLIRQFGQKGDGVIGMDYLATKVLRVNCDDRLAELKSFKTFKVDESTVVEPIHFVRDSPRFLLGVPEEGFEGFVIETAGQLRVMIKQDLFSKLVKKRKIVLDSVATTFDGEQFGRLGIIEYIDLGPYRFCNIPVAEGHINSVGAIILGRFDVEYDFSNRIAYLQPGRRINAPTPRQRIGCQFSRTGTSMIIYQVNTGSPAESSGLKVRDRLVSANGISINDLSRPELEDLVSQPGVVIRFVVERNQNQVDIEVTLANDPDPFPVTEQPAPTPEFDFDK